MKRVNELKVGDKCYCVDMYHLRMEIITVNNVKYFKDEHYYRNWYCLWR